MCSIDISCQSNSSNSTNLSIELNIKNNEPIVTLSLACAKLPAKFLVDSGASVSFISKKLIKNGTSVNVSKKINITSATGHTVQSLGTVTNTIDIMNHSIIHEFHIYDESIPIPADGILGFDFMTKHNCNLNVPMKRVEIRPQSSMNNANNSICSTQTTTQTPMSATDPDIAVLCDSFIFPFQNSDVDEFAYSLPTKKYCSQSKKNRNKHYCFP